MTSHAHVRTHAQNVHVTGFYGMELQLVAFPQLLCMEEVEVDMIPFHLFRPLTFTNQTGIRSH